MPPVVAKVVGIVQSPTFGHQEPPQWHLALVIQSLEVFIVGNTPISTIKFKMVQVCIRPTEDRLNRIMQR